MAVSPSAFRNHFCSFSPCITLHTKTRGAQRGETIIVPSHYSVPKKMPVRLIAADEWRPSTVMERRLWYLEKEGLLRPLTSSTQHEWVALPAEHREQSPPEGYVVSFVKFHHHRLGS